MYVGVNPVVRDKWEVNRELSRLLSEIPDDGIFAGISQETLVPANGSPTTCVMKLFVKMKKCIK